MLGIPDRIVTADVHRLNMLLFTTDPIVAGAYRQETFGRSCISNVAIFQRRSDRWRNQQTDNRRIP